MKNSVSQNRIKIKKNIIILFVGIGFSLFFSIASIGAFLTDEFELGIIIMFIAAIGFFAVIDWIIWKVVLYEKSFTYRSIFGKKTYYYEEISLKQSRIADYTILLKQDKKIGKISLFSKNSEEVFNRIKYSNNNSRTKDSLHKKKYKTEASKELAPDELKRKKK